MAVNIEPLSLPPESTFDSLEQLSLYTQSYAKSTGYAFVIGKRDLCSKGRRVRYFNCKRAGKERRRVNEEYRIRERSTYKCEYRFSIRVGEEDDGTWSIRHREARFGIHNHRPAAAGSFPENHQLQDY